MDNLKFNAFTKYNEDTFFKDISNERSISSGTNQFEILNLYKELMKLEIENQYGISSYCNPRGNSLLVKVLTYYEEFLCGADFLGYKINICMVSGATAGLNFIFDYFSLIGLKKGVMLGYNYTLFKMLGQRYGIELDVLINKEIDKVLPNVDRVLDYLKENKLQFVCLTDPANPSGEMYDRNSFRKLLIMCKEINCLVLIDKCQRDELQLINKSNYYSINKEILDNQMFENVIIVNSFSKIRCIPGARTGYVIANKDIIDYLIYLSTITYWHSNSLCSFAITIDILYQLIYLNIKNKNKYINDFRKILSLVTADIHITKAIFCYLNPATIVTKAYEHCSVIIEQYNIIELNYNFVKQYAEKNKYKITQLDGGFNFSIKMKKNMNESKLKIHLSQTYGLEVFTQEDFCCNAMNSQSNYWIRISCAEEHSSFSQKFLLLSKLI